MFSDNRRIEATNITQVTHKDISNYPILGEVLVVYSVSIVSEDHVFVFHRCQY